MRSLLFGTLLLLSAPASSADLQLDPSTGFIIPVEINGQTLRMKVDPGGSGYLIVNPAAAARAGLKGSLIGARAPIGPYTLIGQSNRPKVKINGVEQRQRVIWTERNVTEGADGVISPSALPYDRVELRFRAPSATDRQFNIPVAYEAGEGLFYPFQVGGDRIIMRFSAHDPASIATASAAAQIANHHGGVWNGAAGQRVIRFGVARPVRPMRLASPLDVHGFQVSHLHVRTADNRGSYNLPAETSNDPDEVVVTAKVKSKQPIRRLFMVGLDQLGRCSSIIYARDARNLVLRC